MESRHSSRAVTALPRAVLDTNVVLDLLVWENPDAAPLRAAVLGGALVCLADEAMLAELARVLGYPQLDLDAAAQARIHAAYAGLVERPPPRPVFATIPPCSDRDDQKFLDLAVSQQADLLLTRDKALLRLARRVRRIAPQLAILTPAEWIARPAGDPAGTPGGRQGRKNPPAA